MDKCKNIQMQLTEVELQRKIERITREIQEAKEEGLKVDMDTAIYKAATVMLDEDLASLMKIKIDVEKETEDLREKLDMLRLKVQEREARIESETAILLAELREMGEKYPVYEQGANSDPDNARPEATEEDEDEEIFYKPPLLGRLKGGDQCCNKKIND
ncbi:hypothetical protein EJD97_004609 [Solanum chilense]|uniref:Uncharacterized protein n=1 Tax=Solanum chilense TaxID=4083 RepID=A0A6N2BSC1_SOLCI|nr:hypothetical protein EJD97_004609 [Solanum chilense]